MKLAISDNLREELNSNRFIDPKKVMDDCEPGGYGPRFGFVIFTSNMDEELYNEIDTEIDCMLDELRNVISNGVEGDDIFECQAFKKIEDICEKIWNYLEID